MSLLAAACGDIDVRSIRTSDAVPQALEGEWSGSWQSGDGADSGTLVLRIQDFAGEPVVSVQVAHPCVKPREYQFRATATTVELLADGEVVFGAVLGQDRTLVGSYQCTADSGTWDASWQRDLPPLLDLSGRWEGTISANGAPPQQLVMHLQQDVRGGALVMDGAAELPGALPEPIGVTGWLEFRDGVFEVLLTTLPGEVPIAFLTGLGDSDLLRIENGLLQAAIDPQLPVLQATWQAAWTGP
jgi:hypothetical protein